MTNVSAWVYNLNMAYPKNEERNKDLIKKRRQDPDKWTWGALAKFFRISRPTAVQIYKRWEHLY